MTPFLRSFKYKPLDSEVSHVNDGGAGEKHEQTALNKSTIDLHELEANTSQVSRSGKWELGLFALLSVVTLVMIVVCYVQPFHSPGRLSLDQLPRPLAFPGFDSINYTGTYFEKADETTFPNLVVPVNAEDPDYVYPYDEHRWWHEIAGTLPGEDKHSIVTNNISTLIQFRTREWGLESCSLRVGLTPSAQKSSIILQTEATSRGWSMHPNEFTLDIWKLDTTRWINPKAISFRNRPKRQSHFASLDVGRNKISRTQSFHCQSDTLVSFEISCRSPICHLDLWQNQVDTDFGIILMQQTTLS